jgi:hypothetical protein
MGFNRILQWLLPVLMSFFLVTGCGDLEPDMQDTRTVILNMDFHGKSSSRSNSSVSAAELSQYNTHLILALPSREYLTSSYKNFHSSFAQGLMNTADKKVSLEIPLNTQMKIFAFLFKENYSMSQLFSGTREVGYYGKSQSFSIGTPTNSLSLGITLIQVPGTGTDTGGETETAGFTVSSISGNTTEAGGTATFTVKLSSQPTANVTIGVSSSDTTEGTVSPSLLTFTSANWNANQTVTVTGVNDSLDDGDQSYTVVLASANSSDSSYSGLNPNDVSVTNTDLAPTAVTIVLYETTTPIRSGNNIVYSQNNSTSYSDSDLQADGARIGYRMEVTHNGTHYYAETIFDAWDGITLNSLLFPTVSNANVIQRTVTNMSVTSNYPTVTNTSSTSGRLEIWPYNYSAAANSGIGGNNSMYDFDDTHSGGSSYGSMQVHNLSAAQTVMAWNHHGVSNPDIGLGNNPATGHPDWTFQGNSSLGTSNWKFQVLFRHY